MDKNKELRVLILEDNPADVELILHELKKGRYKFVYLRVDTAKDMRTAIDEKSWDLIIADYTMPQFSAIDGLNIIKEKGLDLPYIIVSGTIGENKAVAAMKHGAHDYFMKDNLKRLVPAINRELQDAKVRLERKQAEQKIKHLNLVLQAIRNVNQLIVKEKDTGKLIQAVCNTLIETRGYYNAWIVLLEESGKYMTSAEAGLGKKFLPMISYLKQGNLPDCCRKILTKHNIVIIEHIFSACKDCCLAKYCNGRSGMTIRLESNNKIYGLLGITIPENFIQYDEEQSLFKEVAGDVAFALYSIEMEEKRRHIEELLRESEARFRKLLENVPSVAVQGYGPDGTIHYWNKANEFIYGYTKKEAIGKNLIDLIIPSEMRVDVRKIIKCGAQTGEMPPASELLLQHKDGTRVPIFSNHVVVKQSGREPELFCIDVDLTEQKQIEEALRESEKKLSQIIQGISVPSFVINKKHIITHWNKACEKLTGLSADKMIGTNKQWMPFYSAKRPVMADLIVNKMPEKEIIRYYGDKYQKSFLIKGAYEFEDFFSDMGKKKGKWLFCTASPLQDIKGNVIGAIETLQDITERKQAEESLIIEKKWLDVTLHSIGDGIITTNTNEDIILINKVAENFTGYSQRDAIGEPFQDIFHIKNKKTGLLAKSPVSSVLKTGKITGVVKDTVLVSKNGLESYISCTAAPIRNKENRIMGVVLVFRDINLQKKVEENLLKLQKIESLNILAGGIAHDFNNLLSAILGNISIAKMSVKKDGDAFKILTDAEEVSLKARGLSRQLLAFTKTSAPIKKVTSIAKLLKESVNFTLRGTNVKCKFIIPDNIHPVNIDDAQISQVINNLIINAEQAMPSGGIIEISVLNIFLNDNKFFHLKKGDYVKIAVKDTGAGISKENLEKIFDPYFSTKQKGSGLGLAISYSIIKKHNGQINVESHLGKGTTFNIYLPVSKKQKQKKTEINKKDLKGHGKILVMDDDWMVQKSAGRLLNYIGYEVEFAQDGKEAIELYKEALVMKTKFDAVIMDLTIPGGMGGKDAIRKIIQIDPDARVIVSSGYSQDIVVANYKKHGFKGVINKPYTIDELSTVLKEVIEERY